MKLEGTVQTKDLYNFFSIRTVNVQALATRTKILIATTVLERAYTKAGYAMVKKIVVTVSTNRPNDVTMLHADLINSCARIIVIAYQVT